MSMTRNTMTAMLDDTCVGAGVDVHWKLWRV
jgi:hypothetical protein